MRISSPTFSAAAAVVLLAACAVAQAQTPAQPPVSQHEHEHEHEEQPTPTNLKVLPKTMTGEQVHELMHKWAADLGSECSTCHTADPTRIGRNGRPQLNFADDSKPEKSAARLMYTMVEEINTQFVSKVDNSGMPVSCGTCHRGHINPPPYVAPPDHDHDHHEHGAAPEAGQKPPAPR